MASDNHTTLLATAMETVVGVAGKAQCRRDDDKHTEGDNADAHEKATVGMVCEKKDLYQEIDGKKSATWTDKMPDNLGKAAENKETQKYAILVRNRKSGDSRKKLEIDSIVIQSPLLKAVLHDVLKGYPGVTTTLTRLIFSAPFQPFVHRRVQLNAALAGKYTNDTKTHLALLKDILYNELGEVITATEDYIKNKVVTYKEIWTIFEPGCIVYANQLGTSVARRLIDGQFITHATLGPCFELRCEAVDWDGSDFGYNKSTRFISPFEGTVPITDLECFPLAYHPNKEGIREKLVARGRQFEMLAGYHYKSYSGQAIETTRYGPEMITIDGRIIIDAMEHRAANHQLRLSLKPFNSGMKVEYVVPDDKLNRIGLKYVGSGLEFLSTSVKKHNPLKEEQLLICTPVIRGYSLSAKLWLEFFVDSVSEIVFNTNAFDSLVLPEGHKSLILAIAQAQVKKKDVFDDVIAGKGKGIIMLLSGGPGIGKTLTAESVAEHMQVPLYMMSAGDLGVTSTDVEHRLARVLNMVSKWDAIVLLDECDIFLEARSAHDLARNRIVSIFLRTLEYYEGLLFLTTNRVENIDRAFDSRIHIRLAYPDLDAAARRMVWKGFLERQQGGTDISDEDLDKLERHEVNGRVIKNVLKSATLLAAHKNEKLGFRHVETVLELNVQGIKS